MPEDHQKERPQSQKRAQQSAKEGPAAYAPHNEGEKQGERAFPDKEPMKKKTGEIG